MTDAEDLTFDEEAAMEAARERNAVPHLRDILKREHDRILRGHRRDVALEKWGPQEIAFAGVNAGNFRFQRSKPYLRFDGEGRCFICFTSRAMRSMSSTRISITDAARS